jgi:hypothetical protein
MLWGGTGPPGLLGPSLLSLVTLAAAVVCVVGAPWSGWASFAVVFISLLALASLNALSWSVWMRGLRAWDELREERRMVAGLDTRAGALLDQIRADRQLALAENPGGGALAGPRPMGGLLGAKRESLLPIIALEEVRRRYVAGDDLRDEELACVFHDHAEARVRFLERASEHALVLGFVGTLSGFAVQGFIAQHFGSEGIFSQNFLTGSLLAITTTLIGLLVAVYARSLHARLLEGLDEVSSSIRRWLAYHVLPHCDAQSRAVLDLNAVFERTVKGFEAGVDRMTSLLEDEFKQGANVIVCKLAEFTERELVRTLDERVSEPFRAGLLELRGAIDEAGRAVGEGCGALTRITGQFIVDLSETVHTPDQLNRDLQAASDVLAAVTRELARVLEKASEVTTNLDNAAGQVKLTLDHLWTADSRLGAAGGVSLEEAHELVDGMRRSSSRLDSTVETMRSALDDLVGAAERGAEE